MTHKRFSCYGLRVTTLTFDTPKLSRKLESGGVPREQAVVIAEAVADVQTKHRDQLAAKADIASLKMDLTRLEERFDSKLDKLELRMVIKFGAMQLAGIGILLGALKFFSH
jgi:hypothetical protein